MLRSGRIERGNEECSNTTWGTQGYEDSRVEHHGLINYHNM